MSKKRKIAVFFVIGLIALYAGSTVQGYFKYRAITQDLKRTVANEFTDPESCKFRNLSLTGDALGLAFVWRESPTWSDFFSALTDLAMIPFDVKLQRAVRLAFEEKLCGEVNAKNGFGGYSGYQKFSIRNDQYKRVELGSETDADCKNRGILFHEP